MALVAAAVCPHPPLLIPEVGTGVELASRDAAPHAVERLLAVGPDLVVVVGQDRVLREYGPADAGSLAGYGVDLAVPFGSRSSGSNVVLPLSLTVGAWLLRTVGWTGARQGYGLPDTMDGEAAAALGAEISGLAERVALLCMSDGSARRTEKAPGWYDDRAAPFDARVAAALAAADVQALSALEPALARDLLVAGRASWQVLAGAAGDGRWTSELLVDEAPFGVGYFVASWTAVDFSRGDVRR